MAYNATPLATDAYSRLMVDMFDESEIIEKSSLFQAFFTGPRSRTWFSDSTIMEVDISRANKKLAKVSLRGAVTNPIGTNHASVSVGKYTTFSRRSPIIIEDGDVTAAMLEFRVQGENPYASLSQLDRMRQLVSRINTETMSRILRLDEKLASQSILLGTQDAGDGETYDFKRNSNLAITASGAWLTAATDIKGDILKACEYLRKYGKTTANMMFLGSDALQGFLKNTTILAELDNRRIELIRVSANNPVPPTMQRFVDGGAIPYGTLQIGGWRLWMFTYIDTYETDAGVETPYLADDRVLITTDNPQTARYFGPPERLPESPADRAEKQFYLGIGDVAPMPPMVKSAPGVIVPEAFHFDFYKERKVLTAEVQHSPIFAPTQTDAYAVIDTTP
jgi:hypothetical protein